MAAREPCVCGGRALELVHRYTEPPAGEVDFVDGSTGAYERELWRCTTCGHVQSIHHMDLSSLYEGRYVDATYGADGLRQTFERITALPPDRSDNAGRVARLLQFSAGHLGKGQTNVPRLLDVGAGLGVFPNAMARANWDVTALDPDLRAVRHLRETVGVRAIHGDFITLSTDEMGRYDVITFNKVIEHVVDPVSMLGRATRLLAPGGFVYAEVPDGEAAALEGYGREEFFIDHHHVFSAASLTIVVARAGFRVLLLERLREPSTKFTLRAFLMPSATVESH